MELYEFLDRWPYLSWSFWLAAVFYVSTAFSIAHLNDDKKAALSLWLAGEYKSTWNTHFCHAFDRLFDGNHFGWRCMLRSAVASAAAVFLLWVLFDQVLGLISIRTETGVTLYEALLLAVALNLVPDYVSLYQTRWIIKQFERVTNPLGQLAVLAADFIVTGAIFFGFASLFLWFRGEPIVNLVEMVAIFSVYSIFFYSTFLTSVWAWAYCLSTWICRASARLVNWLPVNEAPGRTLALLVAVLVFLGSMAAKPIVTMGEDGRIALDDMLCQVFPSAACNHVARLTENERDKLKYLSRSCLSQSSAECFMTAARLSVVNSIEAAEIFEKSCEAGNDRSCANLGALHARGEAGSLSDAALGRKLMMDACDAGVGFSCINFAEATNDAEAGRLAVSNGVEILVQACSGADPLSCVDLGELYEHGSKYSVEPDVNLATVYYEKACSSEETHGCIFLGAMLERDDEPFQPDYMRAKELYQFACNAGDGYGCVQAGRLHELGLGFDVSDQIALDFYETGCALGEAIACGNLGVIYLYSSEVEQDLSLAAQYFEQGCETLDRFSCRWLGELYLKGDGVEPNLDYATELFELACVAGDGVGCARLGELYLSSDQIAEDISTAARHFDSACKADYAAGCVFLGLLYEDSEWPERDPRRAYSLFEHACAQGSSWGCENVERRNKTSFIRRLGNDQSAPDLVTLEELCLAGNSIQCYILGSALELGGEFPDLDLDAAEAFKKACELGDQLGCSKRRQFEIAE